jgi:hypothetical protein
MKPLELHGVRFGRLIAIERRGPKWFCKCDCGKTALATPGNLKYGNTSSCGCLRIEQAAIARKFCTRHGHAAGSSGSPEYRTWAAMKNRCSNSNTKCFPDYGGRGIKVCREWSDSFESFLEDMGPRPSSRHSIDRIDNNGDYTPENCRWATVKEQMRNRRCCMVVTAFGEAKPLADWCDAHGMLAGTVARRIRRGVSPELALTQRGIIK